MNVLEHALDYAARGWCVFPLVPRTKRPLCEHGFEDATTDPQRITQWCRRRPNCGIGIATGAVSNLVVLDIDPRHDGDDSLAELEGRFGALPETPVSLTGGGGVHHLFAPSNLRGAAETPCRTALGGYRGVDLKGDSGYICAPPS